MAQLPRFLDTNFAYVTVDGKEYNLNNIHKQTKTRSIRNNDGFYLTVKRENLRFARSNFWSTSHYYDHQFESYDMECYLCGSNSNINIGCNCPEEGFTYEEYLENCKKALINYHNKTKIKQK